MFNATVVDNRTASVIFKELVSCVVLPGRDGQLSVMDFHQSMVACLKEGAIHIDDKQHIHIKRGVARAEKNELVVLVER